MRRLTWWGLAMGGWFASTPLWAQGEGSQELPPGAVLAVMLILVLTQLAIWTLIRTLWPGWVRRTEVLLREHPWACFFWGVSWILLTLILLGVSEKVPPLGLLAVLLAVAVVYGMEVGAAGFVSLASEALFREAQRPPAPLFRFLWGGVAVSLALLTPVVGWLLGVVVLLPLSVGAFWLTLPFWGRAAPSESPAGETSAQGEKA